MPLPGAAPAHVPVPPRLVVVGDVSYAPIYRGAMVSGTTIAVVAVLVIVIGLFILFVARRPPPSPPSPHDPPDPAVKGLILGVQEAARDLQKKVGDVAEQAKQLAAAVVAAYKAPLPSGSVDEEGIKCHNAKDCGPPGYLPGIACTGGQCVAPVSADKPLAVQSRVQDAGEKLSGALAAYGHAVSDYYKKVGQWTAVTPFTAFIAMGPDTQMLAAGPVADLTTAIGGAIAPLQQLLAGWKDAFAARYLSVDADPTFGPLVRTMSDALTSFQRLFPEGGSSSPLKSAADNVVASHQMLVNHFLIPPMSGLLGL